MPSMSDCVDVGERFQFLGELMMVAKHGLWYVRMLADDRANNLKDEPAENINWDPALRMANQWFDRVVAAMRQNDRPTRQRRFDQIMKEVKELKTRFLSDNGRERLGMAWLDLETPEAKGKIYGELLFGLIYPPVAKYQIATDRADQQEQLVFGLRLGRLPERPQGLSEIARRPRPQVRGESAQRPLHRQAAGLPPIDKWLSALQLRTERQRR